MIILTSLRRNKAMSQFSATYLISEGVKHQTLWVKQRSIELGLVNSRDVILVAMTTIDARKHKMTMYHTNEKKKMKICQLFRRHCHSQHRCTFLLYSNSVHHSSRRSKAPQLTNILNAAL